MSNNRFIYSELECNNIKYMTSLIPQFEPFKDKIPEFIVKLYHILESKQYSDYMCWYGEGQILIKNGKKLEEKVLPHFFRHRHLSSFVRQLNMYKFNKVNKLTKQKNHMYFRNQHFKRGHIKQMTKIKRNNKKNRTGEKEDQSPEDNKSEVDNSDLSINKELENNSLLAYKQYVKNSVRQISQNLKRIEAQFPETKIQIQSALGLCNQLLQVQQISELPHVSHLNLDQNIQNKNMLSTMRLLPRLQSLVFPSQCSFYHFN